MCTYRQIPAVNSLLKVTVASTKFILSCTVTLALHYIYYILHKCTLEREKVNQGWQSMLRCFVPLSKVVHKNHLFYVLY